MRTDVFPPDVSWKLTGPVNGGASGYATPCRLLT